MPHTSLVTKPLRSLDTHRTRFSPCRSATLALAACVLGVLLAPGTTAQESVLVPESVNYQGVLLKLDGTGPYTSGLYDIQFKIYNASTAGTLLWGQQYTVYVNNEGYFNVVLGEGGTSVTNVTLFNNLRDVFRTSSGQFGRYLGLTVKQDENHAALTSPTECSPRQQFLTSTFAFQSQYSQFANQSSNMFYASKGLTVSGDALVASGGMQSTKGLTVSGAKADLQSGLQVAGNAWFLNGLTVSNATATLYAGLDVSGTATLRGTTALNGATTLASTAQFNGAATFSSTVAVNGVATFAKAVTFNEAVTFAKAATFNDTATFSKAATFNEATTFAKPATFNDTATLGHIVAPASGAVTVTGKVNMFNKGPVTVIARPGAATNVSITARETDGFLLIYGYNSKAYLNADLDGDGLLDMQDYFYFASNGSDTMLITLPMAAGGTATYSIISVEDNGYNRVQWMKLGR